METAKNKTKGSLNHFERPYSGQVTMRSFSVRSICSQGRMFRWIKFGLVAVFVLFWASDGAAQGFGGQGGPMMPRTQGPSRFDNKEEGPAEAAPQDKKTSQGKTVVAPETTQEALTVPELPPWPQSQSKRLELFDIDGYFRFRSDWFHRNNLAQNNVAGSFPAPFYQRLAQSSEYFGCDGDGDDPSDCPGNNFGGANMRLRIEPKLNVSEYLRINAQVDVMDNYIMGSTPSSLSRSVSGVNSLNILSESQDAPIAGVNTAKPPILVKRVWAEIDLPVGTLSVGRMPLHWGLGMAYNDGGCWDCNWGNNVDRAMFRTQTFFGIDAAISYDYASTGPDNLSYGQSSYLFGGQALDMEQKDDIGQWMLMLRRVYDDHTRDVMLARGDTVIDAGVLLALRRQDLDFVSSVVPSIGITDNVSSSVTAPSAMVKRGATIFMPDLWLKLQRGHFRFAIEGRLVTGAIDNVSDMPRGDDNRRLLQGGAVARAKYGLLEDKLNIGLEVGFATGDSDSLNGLNRKSLNRNAQPAITPSSGNLNSEFRFNNDYLVDLILFREIMGTVANAVYIKPSVRWDFYTTFLGSLGGELDVIYSMAVAPDAYPGESRNLGLEFDTHLFLTSISKRFTGTLQYGLLFPMAGLDQLGSGTDARAANTIQANLIVKF